MTQQRDSRSELRAAFTMRLLENAKRSYPTGTTGVFIRVTLAVIFMYLIVISHPMFGSAGPVFVSVLFLAAYFIPYLYRSLKGLLERRRAERENHILGHKSPQEG